MKHSQEQVRKFNDERNWNVLWALKDQLLNVVEETGEAWNIIKWLQGKELEEAVAKNKEEFQDFIGDMLYATLKIANLTNVDAEQAIKAKMEECEKRFPLSETKGKHANIKSGGIDLKYSNQNTNQKQ
jgi:NTP pyrophosphatase (non-canonical NTP hydrolase)